MIRFILRDFAYSNDAADRQRDELRTTEISERELWVSCFSSSHQKLKAHPASPSTLYFCCFCAITCRQSYFDCLAPTSLRHTRSWSTLKLCAYLWSQSYDMAYLQTTWGSSSRYGSPQVTCDSFGALKHTIAGPETNEEDTFHPHFTFYIPLFPHTGTKQGQVKIQRRR